MQLHSVYFDDFNADWHISPTTTQLNILIMVTQGQLSYQLHQTEIDLKKGDILLIPAGTLRSAVNHPTELHQKYSAHFSLDSSDAPSSLFTYEPYQKINSLHFDYLKQRFSVLMQQWVGRFPHFQIICYGILCEILGMIHREIDSGQIPSKKLKLVMQLQEYILNHYRETILVRDLAEHIERTPNYVTTIFREVTGQTPVEYIHHVRVTTARDLLLNTNLTIAEISEQLGYCDQSYFNRVYKKVMGMPPSALLKERSPTIT